MKKVFFCAALLISSLTINAQEIQLDEAKVLVTPQLKVEADNSSSTFKAKISEASKGDFHRDPIAFMKKNLDAASFLQLSGGKAHPFSVTFKSEKGKLVANFNEEGELLSTSQNFRNIILPADLREELYRDYKGWAMVKNKYVAKGNATSIEKEEYHVKLKKGNRTRSIVLEKDDQGYALVMN